MEVETNAAPDEIAINVTNFPDDNFRAWVISNVDKDNDMVLSVAEIEATTDIFVVGEAIAVCKGLNFSMIWIFSD